MLQTAFLGRWSLSYDEEMRSAFVLLLHILAVPVFGQGDIRSALMLDEYRRREILNADPARNTPAVIGAFQDERPLVRQRAAIALREMDVAEAVRLEKEGGPHNDEEYFASKGPRPLVIDALALAASDSDAKVREEAIRSLVWVLRIRTWGFHGEIRWDRQPITPLTLLGPPVIPILISEARSKDKREGRGLHQGMQVCAVQVLAQLRDKRILNLMLWVIDHEDGFLLNEAMKAATEYDDPRVPRMIAKNVWKQIGDYGSPGEWALEKMQGRAVPAMIAEYPRSPTDESQSMLINLLGNSRDPCAQSTLLAALRNRRIYVATAAANKLANFPGAATEKALEQAIREGPDLLKETSKQTLEKLRAKS
jgi:hypothetical protein